MKRLTLIVLIAVNLFLAFSLVCAAEGVEDLSEQVAELAGEESLYDAVPSDLSGTWEDVGFDFRAGTLPEFSSVLRWFGTLLFSLLGRYRIFFFTGIALVLLFRLISAVSSGNERLTESLCWLVAASCGVYSFAAAQMLFDDLKEGTDAVSSFLSAALPVLISAKTMSGSPAGAAALSSAVPFLMQIIVLLIRGVCYPLCLFCFASALSGFHRGPVSLRPLSGAVKRVTVRCAEWLSLICVGVLSVLRTSAGAKDGLTQKTVHFALSRMIPVAGGTLSDGVETMYACAASLGSRSGVAAVLVTAGLFAPPCLFALFFTALYGSLSTTAQTAGVPLLQDLYSDLKDVFSVAAAFALCSVAVLCAALMILTGG